MDKFRPRFSGEIEGFVRNYLRRNFWRVSNVVEMEDVVGDARKIFLECSSRYSAEVDNPRWFMALFKTAFQNYFTSVSRSATLYRSVVFFGDMMPSNPDTTELGLMERLAGGEDDGNGELSLLIDQAPKEVKAVLAFMFNNSTSDHEMFERAWRRQGHRVPDGNRYLCAMLGYDPSEVDLVKMTVEYFSGQNGSEE